MKKKLVWILSFVGVILFSLYFTQVNNSTHPDTISVSDTQSSPKDTNSSDKNRQQNKTSDDQHATLNKSNTDTSDEQINAQNENKKPTSNKSK